MPEHITLKTIHQKRKVFFKKSALLTGIAAVLLIAGGYLFTYGLRMIWAAVIILVSSLTLRTLNRIYGNKMIVTRNSFIESMFPIKERLTKEQSHFIMSDLDYLFSSADKPSADPEKSESSNIQDPLAALYKKLKTNNLTAKDMEKLNRIYSKEFIDLTKMRT